MPMCLQRIDLTNGDDWYLCRLALSMPSQADLQWAMYPSPYLAAVGPDASPGLLVYRLSARQRDGTQRNAQFILLEGGEECFQVDRSSGEVRTTGRPLTPSREYLLRVQVLDGLGRKGPVASVAILAGFRAPQFTNFTYNLKVAENTPVGQAVAMVQAISFQRKSLAYMLLVNPGNLFSIHQESGALSLTRPVDYEGGHTLHSLQVRASEPDTGLSGVAEPFEFATHLFRWAHYSRCHAMTPPLGLVGPALAQPPWPRHAQSDRPVGSGRASFSCLNY
ncbi:unnamed protein product [Arctogadus glacialis]